MARSFLLVLLGLAFVAVHAFPSLPLQKRACSTVNTRKEWHDLSIPERKEFIAAIKCLQETPGVYKNVHGIDQLTAYEDFVYQHKIDTAYVHYVGHFLAWHRYFLWTYEKTLRSTCSYTGYLPYWNQIIDRANSSLSDIYSVDAGFGGNGAYRPQPGFPGAPGSGQWGGGCVQTGPFSEQNYVLRLAPMSSPTRRDHCLDRNFNPAVTKEWSTPEREATLMAKPTYFEFWRTLEGGGGFNEMGMHGGGHATISGTMIDPFVSPGDPLFFMHHANIDRIWRDWQKVDLENRLMQIEGSPIPWTMALGPNLDLIPKGVNVTLDYPVTMGELGPDRTVRDFMDVRSGELCYDYA